MGASPGWKVYSSEGEYVAACFVPSDAEIQSAGESYDFVGKTCNDRLVAFTRRYR